MKKNQMHAITDLRKSTLYDSVWAQIENEKTRQRVIDENEAAKAFESDIKTEEVFPKSGEMWGEQK